jgi:tetratricopeptide (TPR) repeat protein
VKTLVILLAASLSAAAANWTDRTEYDLVLGIRAEMIPQKRLPLLDQWTAKYPKSENAQVRRQLYFAAYQAMNDSAHMLDTAAEMLAAQPDQPFGAYWVTVLLPEGGTATAERLALGEKAASSLVAGPNQLLARRTLGWIHWQRNEYPAAEEELRKCLALDPARAEISAWLGTVLAQQQKAENYVPSLWYLARAAATLTGGQKRQVASVLDRLYTSYHGDTSGLDQLLTAAAASPDPPANFDIESAAVIAIRKQDEALERDNPRLAEWVKTRRKLEAADAEKFFSDTLRNNPFTRIKGTLVRGLPEAKPTELVISVMDPNAPEVVLKLSAELPHPAAAGTPLEFEGVYESFTKAPFLLTLTGDSTKLTGWPKK